jgi:hypothetical protein
LAIAAAYNLGVNLSLARVRAFSVKLTFLIVQCDIEIMMAAAYGNRTLCSSRHKKDIGGLDTCENIDFFMKLITERRYCGRQITEANI